MGYKKLISPEFRVTVGDYEVTDGIEVECFSSKESHMDWCRVELSPQLQGVLKFKDMDEASVELGYEDDFDSLIDGYVRCGDTDYWKEIMIKDDMMKLDRVTIKASFVDCEPQDVIPYTGTASSKCLVQRLITTGRQTSCNRLMTWFLNRTRSSWQETSM